MGEIFTNHHTLGLNLDQNMPNLDQKNRDKNKRD